MKTCQDCGSRVYSGYCTNCNEEHFIYEQNRGNEEPIEFSKEFLDKVKQDEIDSINRLKKNNN